MCARGPSAVPCRFTGSQLCSTCEELADALGEQGKGFPSSCLTASPVMTAAVSDLGCMRRVCCGVLQDTPQAAPHCLPSLHPVSHTNLATLLKLRLMQQARGWSVTAWAAAWRARAPPWASATPTRRWKCAGTASGAQAWPCVECKLMCARSASSSPWLGRLLRRCCSCGLPCPYHLHPPVLYVVWTCSLPAWCSHCQECSVGGYVSPPPKLARSVLLWSSVRARVRGPDYQRNAHL